MIYTIINPSDPYTVEAHSLDVAAIACVILGNGQYAFEPTEKDQESVPMFFGSFDPWFQSHFNETLKQTVERVRRDKRKELADCLDSVLIGRLDARKDFLSGRDPNETRESFEKARFERHDERRSSFNDIGGRAYKTAANLRKDINEFQPAPQQVFVR